MTSGNETTAEVRRAQTAATAPLLCPLQQASASAEVMRATGPQTAPGLGLAATVL